MVCWYPCVTLRIVVFYKNTLFVVAIVIVVLIGILYWFFGTELGCSIRSTWPNQNMSRAQGINTDMTKIIGLMLSNGIVAFSSGLWRSTRALRISTWDAVRSLLVWQLSSSEKLYLEKSAEILHSAF